MNDVSWQDYCQTRLVDKIIISLMNDITKEAAMKFWDSAKNIEHYYNGVKIPNVEVQVNCQYEVVKGADFDIDKPIEI